jgi:ferredoxin--NADP+ reductase/benzoate/toluate 1,2-dioxygenase reductase subunit
MHFRAGQHIIVGLYGEIDQREYSIYSGEKDDYLEILVREVGNGNISVKLKNCSPGQLLNVNGPFGSFGIESFDLYEKKHVFIATGTGISPFHCMVKSYPDIDYTLIHGVSFTREAYDRNDYEAGRYILCTSRESTSGIKSRVTDYLRNFTITPGMVFYLCGNGNMIYSVNKILSGQGISSDRIFSERYF